MINLKNLVLKSIAVCAFLTVGSCMSDDSEEYFPKPENGDYVMVDEMKVKGVSKADPDVFKVGYNRKLQPISLSVTNGLNLGIEDKVYKFKYSDKQLLTSIDMGPEESNLEKWVASYDGFGLSGFKSDKGEVEYVRENSKWIAQAKYGTDNFTYTYNKVGDLIAVNGQDVNLEITYTKTHNPFVYVNFNLFYFYMDGLQLLSLVQGAKFNMESVVDKKTNTTYTFSYEYDGFGYVTGMKVLKNDKLTHEIAFKTNIYRLMD